MVKVRRHIGKRKLNYKRIEEPEIVQLAISLVSFYKHINFNMLQNLKAASCIQNLLTKYTIYKTFFTFTNTGFSNFGLSS